MHRSQAGEHGLIDRLPGLRGVPDGAGAATGVWTTGAGVAGMGVSGWGLGARGAGGARSSD